MESNPTVLIAIWGSRGSSSTVFIMVKFWQPLLCMSEPENKIFITNNCFSVTVVYDNKELETSTELR